MKVIFFSTQTQARQDLNDSESTNFSEVMSELNQEISPKMRYYIKETKVTLEHPDAEIPDHDFTLVASPRDNKANQEEYTLQQLKEIKTKFNNLMNFLMDVDPGDEQEESEEDCPNCNLLDEIDEIEAGFSN